MDEKRLRKGITTAFICAIVSVVIFAASIILMIYSIAINNWIYFAAFLGVFVGSVIAILISRYIMDLGEVVIQNHRDMDELLSKLKLKRNLDRGYEVEKDNANNVDTPHFILPDLNKAVYYVTEDELSEIQIRTAYFSRKLFEHALEAKNHDDKLRILGSFEYKGHRFYDANYGSFVHSLREDGVNLDEELNKSLKRIDSIIKFKEVKFN